MPPVDWDAASYDRLSGPQARWGREVLARLDLAGDETVLDAGCGSGRVTEELVQRLPRGTVVALDSSPAMLEQACRRLGRYQGGTTMACRVRLVQADLLDLSPAHLDGAAPLDAVFSTATFHWVTDHDRLFANLRALLRPGGQLVAQCGGKGNLASVVETVRRLGTERAGTWLYASADETAERLERAGFTGVRCWCNRELVPFPDREALADFLQTVCLREHLGTLLPEERRSFAERVAAAMPVPAIDYVRLNIVARAGPA